MIFFIKKTFVGKKKRKNVYQVTWLMMLLFDWCINPDCHSICHCFFFYLFLHWERIDIHTRRVCIPSLPFFPYSWNVLFMVSFNFHILFMFHVTERRTNNSLVQQPRILNIRCVFFSCFQVKMSEFYLFNFLNNEFRN